MIGIFHNFSLLYFRQPANMFGVKRIVAHQGERLIQRACILMIAAKCNVSHKFIFDLNREPGDRITNRTCTHTRAQLVADGISFSSTEASVYIGSVRTIISYAIGRYITDP